MFVVYAIVAIVLAVVLTVSGVGTITRQQWVVDTFTGVGVPPSWFPMLGAAKLAGALGLIIGLWVPVIGILAGFGVFAYFVGAVIAHLRANDKNIAPPVVLGLLGLVAAILRIASA